MADQKTQSEQTTKGGNKQKQGNGSHGALTTTRPRMLSAQFSPFSRLRTEFDRLFDDFFQGWPGTVKAADFGQGVDVQERDDAVVVRADAPGFDAGDFDVEIRGDNLVLCACQSEESSEEDGFRWQKRELYRSVALPAEIDADKIDAKYRNGILTIKLPKTEQAKGRKIEIKS
jgi:HSP20 family protein